MLGLSGCDDRLKEWTGWVYADRYDLTKSVKLAGVETFEECQEAAIYTLRTYENPDAGDYECGYMCKYDPDMQTNVCKETRK